MSNTAGMGWVHGSIFLAALAAFALLLAAVARFAPGARTRFRQRVERDSRDRLVVVDPSTLWRLQWVASLVVAAGIAWWTERLLFAVLMAILAAAIPHWLIARLRRMRLQRLREQLPDFLMLVAGSLRAGSGLVVALSRSVAGCPAPARQQLELVLADIRLGVSVGEAMAAFERRAPVEEVTLMATALRVGLESGGSLASALESLGEAMRGRLALEARVKALTAQGRLQAWIMSLLPALIVALLAWVDRASFDQLVGTEAGRWLLLVVGLAQLLGFKLVKKIVEIEV